MTHSQINTHKHYQQLSLSDRATIQALRLLVTPRP